MLDSGRHDITLQRAVLAAREDERKRCARELHDDTLQALAALRVQLSAARRGESPELLRQAIDGAVDELGREIDNLRSIITELRPATLDELGLRKALGALFERAFALYGLRVRSVLRLDPGRLPAEVEISVYRVVQEALTNAARHSGAGLAHVSVLEADGEVQVSVRDDGRGFDPGAGRLGFGLLGMRERVALAEGTFELHSSPAGTEVRVTLPLHRADAVVHGRRLAYS